MSQIYHWVGLVIVWAVILIVAAATLWGVGLVSIWLYRRTWIYSWIKIRRIERKAKANPAEIASGHAIYQIEKDFLTGNIGPHERVRFYRRRVSNLLKGILNQYPEKLNEYNEAKAINAAKEGERV